MSENQNPAANGGARTVANAVGAGEAENSRTIGAGKDDCAAQHSVPRRNEKLPAFANSDDATMFRHADASHVNATIWLLRALVLGVKEPKYWLLLSEIWAGRLSKRELNDVAEAVLRKLGPEDLGELAGSLMRDAGWPRAYFLNLMEEARAWAAIECRETLKAYTLVCFEALPRKDQVAFLDYLASAFGMTGTIRRRGRRLGSGSASQGTDERPSRHRESPCPR